MTSWAFRRIFECSTASPVQCQKMVADKIWIEDKQTITGAMISQKISARA